MATPPSGRILRLLELADDSPTVDDLESFLTDPDPHVRRTALSVLSEAAESWVEPSLAIAAALTDPDAAVRETAIDLLGELREVLVASPELGAELRTASRFDDIAVRAAAVGALWRHRMSTLDELTVLFLDPDETVRGEVVLGFVSLDALDALGLAAADPEPAVRLGVARGLAAIGDPRAVATLIDLAADADALVRAAALTAMARTGCTDEAADIASAALADPAWQVRQAAATALSAADPATAAAPLMTAAGDDNLDVRKAAVRALAAWLPRHPEVRVALEKARADADADVRAFARIGLAEADDTNP